MILFLSLIFLLSWALTLLLRRYALRTNRMDIPNHRSSHTIPTPRGGGLAIVISFFCALFYLTLNHLVPIDLSIALYGGGGTIALLGFLDDRGHVEPRWRLLGHFLAGAWILYWLGGAPPMDFFNWTLKPGIIANSCAMIYIVWLLNLYNFMDGIDGIASVEAICICLNAALLYWLLGATNLLILPLILTATTAGFLYWNFPPARIFMGDVGSGFLGVILATLTIQAAITNQHLFWSWIILLGIFMVDATTCLARRAYLGCKLQEAHHSHAYQHAARYFNGHLPVTAAIAIINIVWLGPIALLVGLGKLQSGIGVLIAYAPLIILSIKFEAGVPDNPKLEF